MFSEVEYRHQQRALKCKFCEISLSILDCTVKGMKSGEMCIPVEVTNIEKSCEHSTRNVINLF